LLAKKSPTIVTNIIGLVTIIAINAPTNPIGRLTKRIYSSCFFVITKLRNHLHFRWWV